MNVKPRNAFGISLALGILFGLLFHNLALGIIFGLIFGGAASETARRRGG